MGFGYCVGPNCDRNDPTAGTLTQTGYIRTQTCSVVGVESFTYCASGQNQNGYTGVCSGDSGGPSVMLDAAGACTNRIVDAQHTSSPFCGCAMRFAIDGFRSG